MAWLVNPPATRSKISIWRGVSRAKPPRSVLDRLLARPAVERAREPAVDGGDQLRVVDRLLDEILGARLDGGDRHRHVGMAGDQHDRQRDAAARQLAHELDAVHARHAHVGDDAARPRRDRTPRRKPSADS